MEDSQIKEEIMNEIKKKYRIDSYKKTVETIIDITLAKVKELK